MEREVHKLKKQRKWYGKTKDAVIFMQATPGECLKKAVQEVCDRSGLRVKVVEKGVAMLGRYFRSHMWVAVVSVEGRNACYV